MADRKRKVGINSRAKSSETCDGINDLSNGVQEALTLSDEERVSTARRDRRVSAPCGHSLERRKSFDDMPHLRLKVVKSTPQSFAPLCVIGDSQYARHLHGCKSHCYLPHLDNKRRVSCPQPSVFVLDDTFKTKTLIKQRPRRHSYAGEHTCHYKHGGRLHRCSSQYKARLQRPRDAGKHRLIKNRLGPEDLKRVFSEPNMQRDSHSQLKHGKQFKSSHSFGYLSCSFQSLKEHAFSLDGDIFQPIPGLLSSITEEGIKVRFIADY